MECSKRQKALQSYAESIDLTVIYQDGYDVEGFLQQVVFRESERFSTTLLHSKFQQHDLIQSIGEAVGRSVGIPFYYHDFRSGWTAGVQMSKELGLYRQQYCGCIYSEKERYYK